LSFTRLSDRATRAPLVPSVIGRMVSVFPSAFGSVNAERGCPW
jgi:hypothetical protein